MKYLYLPFTEAYSDIFFIFRGRPVDVFMIGLVKCVTYYKSAEEVKEDEIRRDIEDRRRSREEEARQRMEEEAEARRLRQRRAGSGEEHLFRIGRDLCLDTRSKFRTRRV